MRALDHLHIPDFQEFIMKPYNRTCPVIDATRLMVEILGGIHPAGGEFGASSFASKMLLDGDIALVMRYQREKDGLYRPTCAIGFDIHDSGIHVRQIQGSNDKNVAFRFHSSFNTTGFLLRVIEESFVKKGILVTAETFPTGLENASYASRASDRYNVFRTGLEGLKRKYQMQ